MEKFLRLIALITFLAGAFVGYTGYEYRLPQGQAAEEPLIPFAAGYAKKTADYAHQRLARMSPAMRGTLRYESNGLLVLLGGIGALGLIISFIVYFIAGMLAEARQRRETHRISWEEEQTPLSEDDGPQKTAASRYKMEIDEDMLNIDDSSQDDDDIFENIESVIALAHSALEPEMSDKVLRSLRPDLLPFSAIFTPLAWENMAKQVLNHYILSHKRSQKSISPDQFRLQDERVNETARATVSRRFMPKRPAHFASADMRTHIGQVYHVSEQAGIQQKTASNAEDWLDVSLRNATEMLKIPAPEVPSSAAAAPAAAPTAAPAQTAETPQPSQPSPDSSPSAEKPTTSE